MYYIFFELSKIVLHRTIRRVLLYRRIYSYGIPRATDYTYVLNVSLEKKKIVDL